MKKLIASLFSIVLVTFFAITVSAAENISFGLNSVNVDKNRLFTVEMTAECSSPLSAATFEFAYDNNLIEYRSIKTDNNSKVSVNELNGKLKVVYLNSYGKDISNGEVIFSITFKAINSGSSDISFYVSDCVNADVKSVNIGECTSATVTVNGSNKENTKSQNSKSSESETSETTGKKSTDKEEETTSTSTYDELGILNPIDDSNIRNLIIGICIGASAVIFIGVGILLGVFLNKKLDKNKQSSDYD